LHENDGGILFYGNRALRLYPVYFIALILNLTFSHSPSIAKFFILLMYFMISGFYLSLLYTKNDSSLKTGQSIFYSNRALHLYPNYFFALFIFFVLYPQDDEFFNPKYWIFMDFYSTISNLTLLGADTLIFFNKATIVGPAWSLGSEILFYLMVPFIVTRPFVVVVLLVGSLSVQAFFIANGYEYHTFLYRLFPSVLAFFLMGNLGFYIYNKAKDYSLSRYIGIGGITFFIIYIACKSYQYEGFFVGFFDAYLASVKAYILIFALALFIPFLFIATKNSKIDRFIGNLSYSIFLFHVTVIDLCRRFSSSTFSDNSDSFLAVTVILTILFSICVYFIIEKPIDSIRQKRVDNAL
jgi:peptidoglycan/LPS O-acetylase OafA/YrhL